MPSLAIGIPEIRNNSDKAQRKLRGLPIDETKNLFLHIRERLAAKVDSDLRY